MKFIKVFLSFLSLLLIFCTLSACKQKIDYLSYVSELRKNLFTQENQDVSLLVYAGAKEKPAIFDGVKNDTRLIVGVKAIFKEEPSSSVIAKVCFEDKCYEIPLDFHPVKLALAGEMEVPILPEQSVEVTLCFDQKEICLTANSIIDSKTISYDKALDSVAQKASDFFNEHTKNGVLRAEIIVRLLREGNKNYYYVGLVCEEGLKRSYLVDATTGEIVAEKIN